jgi:hypothetical protein
MNIGKNNLCVAGAPSLRELYCFEDFTYKSNRIKTLTV